MKRAVYPGSFDPITNGHLDIIKRASEIFDEVIVGALVNPDKKGLFDITERVNLIEKSTSNIRNVRVESFTGLLIDFMKKTDTKIIVKGLRAISDFEYEFQMAMLNNKLDSNIETVFLMTSEKNSYISSSSIKQIAMFGGSITDFVPEIIVNDILDKFKK
ncbi:pantetheine-phosphate adenylyltransferase [Candidatus Clostridium stratigraminis]|uniref:Phosphopantetheine adenylyltransferase n=1 Tax=Candidatus Clostridium stratigraminis TaxID=3381661 RepID=A0ABW8T4H0_9CLOT